MAIGNRKPSDRGDMMDTLIFGAGYTGCAYGALLANKDYGSIAGTTRNAERFAQLEASGLESFIFDGKTVSPQLAARLETVTHMIISAAPGATGDPVLEAGRDLISNTARSLNWIGYLSTIGVYGDHGGNWVNEESECHPDSERSKWRLAAERSWLELGAQTGAPVAILRLAGIYGPGRNPFVKLRDGKARRVIKKNQVFNRIHVVDIARAIYFLATRKTAGIFNVTDDEPAPPQDVVGFAAGLMGVEPPPLIDFDQADFTPMARTFYGENKRVSNRKLKQEGFNFLYPEYRSTLRALWEKDDWREA